MRVIHKFFHQHALFSFLFFSFIIFLQPDEFLIVKWKQAIVYNNNYLKLRFTSVVVNGEIRLQFRLCLEVLAYRSLKEAELRRHLEWKYVKDVDEILKLFKEKKFQVTRSRTHRPSTLGVKTYSQSKAVRASFSDAWKNARAKAPYTAGKSLVKPAAVTIVTSHQDSV